MQREPRKPSVPIHRGVSINQDRARTEAIISSCRAGRWNDNLRATGAGHFEALCDQENGNSLEIRRNCSGELRMKENKPSNPSP
jgi:hypothetical protein